MDIPLTVTEAARRLEPFVARSTLYSWIRRGEIRADRSPGGRQMIRESEVQRILAWYRGDDIEGQSRT